MTAAVVRLRPRLTPADIRGRKMVNAMHIDFARRESAWMGGVDGVPRLGVVIGHGPKGKFERWLVDDNQVRDLEAAIAVLNGDMSLEDAMREDVKPSQKFSITAQLAEIDRELALRSNVYPSQVKSRRMTESQAAYHVDVLKGVRATLAWFEANEQLIKQRLSY